MKTSHVPVLVVGAGAAGTMLTLELARRGVAARTVDRLPRPGDTSKAITMHARTLEILERIDRRLVDRFLNRGIHNLGYVLHFVDADGRRSEVRPRERTHAIRVDAPHVLHLLALPATEQRREALEASLAGLAKRFASVLELRTVPPSDALAARYGASDDDRLLLVRPDGYVGFRCKARDVASLEAHLREWLAI